jgi:pilus assembly protein CpaB
VRQRSGGMVILVVSVIAGLMAAFLSVQFLQGVSRSTTVLVAAHEIPAFTPLTPDMFRSEQLPSKAVPADAVRDAASLSGRYARTILLPGTVVRQGHMATASGSAGSLAAKLTETGAVGMRAIAIPIDNTTGVGGTIQAGDKIDVIAAIRVERQNSPVTTMSKTIATALPVLLRTETDGTSKATVVVMVTPQQAEDIAFAMISGSVYLATNPYRADAEPVKTNGVTPDSFMSRYSGR